MKRLLFLLCIVYPSYHLQAQTIRLATYQYASNNRIDNISPLAGQLEKETGHKVEVKSYPDIPAFIKAIQENQADVALISTFGYFLLDASATKHSMVPALTLAVPASAKDNYKTAMLCRKETRVFQLADTRTQAKHLRAALVAPGSTSGNLVPRLAFSGIGVNDMESSFASVEYSKTHDAAIQFLFQRKADIAAMGYTEYEKLLRHDSASASKLRLVWLSPEIPLGPVLLNKTLSQKTSRQVISCLLALEKTNKAALESVKAGWSEAKQATHYIRIGASFYDPFRSMLGSKEALRELLGRFVN